MLPKCCRRGHGRAGKVEYKHGSIRGGAVGGGRGQGEAEGWSKQQGFDGAGKGTARGRNEFGFIVNQREK